MTFSHRALLLIGAAGLASCSASPARADEKGEKVLREAYQKLYSAKTYAADLATEFKGPNSPTVAIKGHVLARKPNRLRYEAVQTYNNKTQPIQYVSDGKSYFMFSGGNIYMRQPAAATPESFSGNWEGEVDAFFGGPKLAAQLSADYSGTETVEGVLCDVVKTKPKNPQDPRVITYDIGQKDHLIHRTTWQDPNKQSFSSVVSNMRLDAQIADGQFAFVPPKGAKEYDPSEQMRQLEAKLVPVGQEAPAFEATDPVTNSRFSLAQAMDKKKAVLVNFWFYG